MLDGDITRIHAFEVVPALPEPLQPLLEVANNLWWSWHPEAVELFARLEPELWHQCHHNPVKLLGQLSQERLDTMAQDQDYLADLARVRDRLTSHMGQKSEWVREAEQKRGPFTIAYFCAEFGLTESLQVYSGGLGILAGDHLKSASELGLPLVGVGLLYRHGYFQQQLNADGWQEEYLPDLDFSHLPLQPVRDQNNQPIKVEVHLGDRPVQVAVWETHVGQVPLYLLDTNLQENDPDVRGITGQLYGGDLEMRIKQEIVLGIGGVRALDAGGLEPDVCHMNEGHSAFLALERIRRIIERHGITFDEARQQAAASHVFTTHTPVPAGIDRFPPDMMQRYFKPYHEQLRLEMESLLALGREDVANKNEFFSMATLAVRTADWCNGVSRLHGEVSREMWHTVWPGVPKREVPIGHVTNGVHERSWLSPELAQLFDRHLGSQWRDTPDDPKVWEPVYDIPDEALWQAHEARRFRMMRWVRQQLRQQLEHRGGEAQQVHEACEALSDNALTIGFARRFATYKRGTLFMRDPERLSRILANSRRPVQLLIAGKAHPDDNAGKELIREIVKFAEESEYGHRIVFLENYDINVARYLVQGCDLWLNNPRRGLEASGTSGMKSAINGGLNCSVLDGWWDEAYDPEVGWAIGKRETYSNLEHSDEIKSKALYDLLENHILPTFYDRDQQGVPREWVSRMKSAIARLTPQFNTHRMLHDYSQHYYLPAVDRARELSENHMEGSIALAHQKDRLRQAWPEVHLEQVEAPLHQPLGIDQNLSIEVTVHLGPLSPEEVRVQVYHGLVDNDNQLLNGQAVDLEHTKDLGQSRHQYRGRIRGNTSGRHGFAVRVLSAGPLGMAMPGLIRWEGDQPKPAGDDEGGEEEELVAQEAN